MVQAIILGIKSTRLSEEERQVFTEMDPLGFILFARNIESREQLKDLIENLRSISGRKHLPIFIDQEGGRVQRLKANLEISRYPAAKIFGDLAETSLNEAGEICRINYHLLGLDLKELGINVNCAPCIDLTHKDGHNVIGDRSFSSDPKIVSELGKEAIYGLKEAGIMPVIKHIPGHGRSKADSHYSLPIIDSSVEELEQDFIPFKEAAQEAEIAMTAHIIYTAIDPEKPATLSKKVINSIRDKIGFKKINISDDICMKALSGEIGDVALEAYNAGCDLILHCSGILKEIKEIKEVDLPINDKVKEIFLIEENSFAKIERESFIRVADKNVLKERIREKTGHSYSYA